MNDKLSPALRRAAALAILLALIAILYLGIAIPIVGAYQSLGSDTAQLQEQLVRYQRAALQRAQRQAELAALERRSSAEDGFLQGANDTLIAVQIQNRLKTLSDAAGAELRSTQVLSAQDEGALRRISVRGQLSTSIAGVLKIFHDLEAQSPLLFLDNVDIRSRQTSAREGHSRRDSSEGALDLQFDVYGYTQRGK